MAELTKDAKDRALDTLFEGSKVGLTRNGRELNDPGYKRQSVTYSESKDARGGFRAIQNADWLYFGPFAMDMMGPVSGWILCSSDGLILMEGELIEEDRQRLRAGDQFSIHPSRIVLGVK